MKRKARYIFSKGELRRKNNTIIFKNENGNKFFPIEEIKELYCFNDITISTQVIKLLNKYKVNIHFFDHYENYVASVENKNDEENITITEKLLLLKKENGLEIGKEIVKGILQNQISLLYHYYRHGEKDVKKNIDNIKEIMKKINVTSNEKQLLLTEAKAWQELYDALPKLIKQKDFSFEKRVKQKNLDEVNSMISFINSLLYAKVRKEFFKTKINPKVSFLHANTENRNSLVLDIADIFKPLLTYKVMLKLINKKSIKKNIHFENSKKGTILNEEGRKIIIAAFEEKINETVYMEKLKRKVSYETLFKIEAYKIIKYSLDDDYTYISYKEEV